MRYSKKQPAPEKSTRITRSNSLQAKASATVSSGSNELQTSLSMPESQKPNVSLPMSRVTRSNSHLIQQKLGKLDLTSSLSKVKESFSKTSPSTTVTKDMSSKTDISSKNNTELTIAKSSIIIDNEQSPEQSKNDENKSKLKKSSFKMDEDFDIDEFLGNAKPEVTIKSDYKSEIKKEISDEDFLNEFPKINMNEFTPKIMKPAKRKSVTPAIKLSSSAKNVVEPIMPKKMNVITPLKQSKPLAPNTLGRTNLNSSSTPKQSNTVDLGSHKANNINISSLKQNNILKPTISQENNTDYSSNLKVNHIASSNASGNRQSNNLVPKTMERSNIIASSTSNGTNMVTSSTQKDNIILSTLKQNLLTPRSSIGINTDSRILKENNIVTSNASGNRQSNNLVPKTEKESSMTALNTSKRTNMIISSTHKDSNDTPSTLKQNVLTPRSSIGINTDSRILKENNIVTSNASDNRQSNNLVPKTMKGNSMIAFSPSKGTNMVISNTHKDSNNTPSTLNQNVLTSRSSNVSNTGSRILKEYNIVTSNTSDDRYTNDNSSNTLKVSHMAGPSTSGSRSKNVVVKRNHNDTSESDDDLENYHNTKKPKIESDFQLPRNKYSSQSPLKKISCKKYDSDLNDSDSFLDEVDSNRASETEDEYAKSEDALNDYEFPNLGEDINFDVNAIRSNVQSNYRGIIGEKRRNEYFKERHLTKECIEKLHESIINIPKDAIERDPRGLIVTLMPHQRHALKWMRWREEQTPKGGILADEMGLGKTIQMIALILAAKNEKKARAKANGEAICSDDDYDEDWGYDDVSRQIFDGRTLVVCPASVAKQWEREVQIRCRTGFLRVFVYHGTYRNISAKQLSKYDIVITTYHLVSQEQRLHMAPSTKRTSKLFRIKWERVVLDEAHYIRNPQSQISKAACELSAKKKWALTGTPIQNRKSDLFALLKFLKCSPFDKIAVWRRWVSNNKANAGYQRLTVITKSLMLRRTKEELIAKGAIQELPKKTFDIIQIDLDPEEKVVYQNLLCQSRTLFDEFLYQRKQKQHLKEFGCHMRPDVPRPEVPDKISKLLRLLQKHHSDVDNNYIFVLILRLRQMCCHPALIKRMIEKDDLALSNSLENDEFDEKDLEKLNGLISDDDDDNDDDDDYGVSQEITKRVMSKANSVFRNDRRGSKVRAVLDVVHSILEKGEKVIVVSQWTSFLNIIANNLYYMKNANYEMFSGKLAFKDRQAVIDRLNDSDEELNVLLLSLTAGGVGLNLIGANHLLLIDLHWNPQLETQAMDRIHRFGQENDVHIYKFICKDTIEEKIKDLQDKKLKIAADVLTGSVSNTLTIEDLKLLFS